MCFVIPMSHVSSLCPVEQKATYSNIRDFGISGRFSGRGRQDVWVSETRRSGVVRLQGSWKLAVRSKSPVSISVFLKMGYVQLRGTCNLTQGLACQVPIPSVRVSLGGLWASWPGDLELLLASGLHVEEPWDFLGFKRLGSYRVQPYAYEPLVWAPNLEPYRHIYIYAYIYIYM